MIIRAARFLSSVISFSSFEFTAGGRVVEEDTVGGRVEVVIQGQASDSSPEIIGGRVVELETVGGRVLVVVVLDVIFGGRVVEEETVFGRVVNLQNFR